jgi:DNA polymerase III delta prime subunit
MITVIGQKRLVATLSTYTFSNMPATTLLLGPKGGGKHFITERLAKQLGVELVVIDPKCTAEDLVEYSQYPVPRLYLIELIGVTEKAQNKFLKFIEEPSSTVRVVLTAESEVGILNTVLNRCSKLALEPYTIQELKSFSWAPATENKLVYELCCTPGQLLALEAPEAVNAAYELCRSIVERFPTLEAANYGNAMSTCAQISYKEGVRKLDFNLFLDTLIYTAFEVFKETQSEYSFKVYQYVSKKKQEIMNKTIMKESFMLNLINSLWEMSRA